MDNILSKANYNINKLYCLIEVKGYELLDSISNINSDIFLSSPLKQFYLEDNFKYIKLLLYSVMFGSILFFFFKMVLSMYNSNEFTNIYSYILKVIVVVISSYNSRNILSEIININSLFSYVIDSFLEQITNNEISYMSLTKEISSLDDIINSNLSLDNIIKYISLVFYINMLFIYSTRYVGIIICCMITPFAFFLLLDEKLKKIYYIYIKTFILNIIVQNINKFILFIPIVSKEEKLYELIFIGAVYLLYKVNIEVENIWKK